MARKKHKKSNGRTSWRKKFGACAKKAHASTTTPLTFGKAMKQCLK